MMVSQGYFEELEHYGQGEVRASNFISYVVPSLSF